MNVDLFSLWVGPDKDKQMASSLGVWSPGFLQFSTADGVNPPKCLLKVRFWDWQVPTVV